jgi:hypothetical protein
MSMDYYSIGFESEAAFGKMKSNKAPLNTPENKREIPCDTCSLAAGCEAKFLECSAFRNWASTGDYADSDVGRYVRAAK